MDAQFTQSDSGGTELVSIPGNFHKLTRGGRTIARIHANVDGTWAGMHFVTGARLVFPGLEAALAWFRPVVTAEAVAGMFWVPG
jgi:hypothetical protein